MGRKKKRGSPQHIISNFLGRSRTSKFEDRSENRMRFSERSRICLIPRRHAPANPFGGDPIACNLLLSPENRMRFSGDRGDKSEIRVAGRGKRQIQRIWTFGTFFLPSFPISSESEGRPSPQIPLESEGTRNQRLRGPLRFQRNLRGRPFLRFRYFFLFLVLFLSEKGRVFPELRRSRGKYRKRKKFALFPRFPPIPLEWEKTSGKKGPEIGRKGKKSSP